MFTNSTSKVSEEHVNRMVKSILNKRQRNILDQQKTFIRRNTDENNKRNNYLVDKFTVKKPTSATKENAPLPPPPPPVSPKKKPLVTEDEDDDEDFISTKKRPRLIQTAPKETPVMKIDPIRECLDAIITQIEQDDATCPICNQVLASLLSLDQREQHVNRCLEEMQINHIETKQQKSLLSYSKFSSTSTSKKAPSAASTSHFKCQICGLSFNVKRTYLAHLKKCSSHNSVQLKHVIQFAAKTAGSTVEEPKPSSTVTKKKATPAIKNRIIKMEVPRTEDDEQQQLAIALSASMKSLMEPSINAFEVLQAAAKKTKTIDLSTTPLWTVSPEEKLRLCSTRLLNLCERLVSCSSSIDAYQFPPSPLLLQSQAEFGLVDWWNITQTDPQDDEIPMTQLARILNDDDEEDASA